MVVRIKQIVQEVNMIVAVHNTYINASGHVSVTVLVCDRYSHMQMSLLECAPSDNLCLYPLNPLTNMR